MKLFIILVHVLIGSAIVYLNLNSQLVIWHKVHDTANYYTPEQRRNQGIIEHIQTLKHSERRIVIETIFGVSLGLCSIIAAIGFIQEKRWANSVLPLITVVTIAATLYSSRSATGFAAAASVLPTGVLVLFLVSEILYLTAPKKRA